jgi:hypothetical protein
VVMHFMRNRCGSQWNSTEMVHAHRQHLTILRSIHWRRGSRTIFKSRNIGVCDEYFIEEEEFGDWRVSCRGDWDLERAIRVARKAAGNISGCECIQYVPGIGAKSQA